MHKRIEIDGRPHWLFATGEVLPVVSGADGEGGSGDGKGGSGGEGDQGGSGQSGSGSNMDPEGDGGDGGQGGDGDGGNKPDPKQPLTLADFERMQAEREQKLFDRLADSSGKQVKNALKEAGLGKKPEGEGGKGQGGEGGKGGEGAKSGPSDEDIARAEADRKRLVRDSRAATRDVMSETVKFMGNFEREDAMHDASGLISGLVASGETDEEAIGQKVAKEVKERLEGRRKFYEDRVMASLKRKGLLIETPGQGTGGGQGAGGGNQPQMTAAFAAGRDRANSMYRPDQKTK